METLRPRDTSILLLLFIGVYTVLRSNHVDFRIVRGCDASGVVFLLFAAIVAIR
jgi:hypothetical protein